LELRGSGNFGLRASSGEVVIKDSNKQGDGRMNIEPAYRQAGKEQGIQNDEEAINAGIYSLEKE
jgi:hypothetical protein